jgi:predicted nucleic-acid-binding Zn-ribbon protein
MKRTQRCSKCGHPRVWRIAELRIEGQESANAFFAVPLALVGEGKIHGTDDSTGSYPSGRMVAGRLELYACADCGYSELYARDLDKLPALADRPDANVTLLEGDRIPHPYR